MQSTFSGVEIARRGILAHSQLLRTTGHNLSNINSPGYSRQRVTLASEIPRYMPGAMRAEVAGQIGQGVNIQSIRRQKDMQIEEQIIAQSHKQGFWDTRSKYIEILENIQNEVDNSTSLRGAFDRYWTSWEEFSIYPQEMSVRLQLVERTQTLIAMIRERSQQLDQVQDSLHIEIDFTVSKINELAQEIATLNSAIQQAKSLQIEPNDLLDKRDMFLQELGKLVNITTSNKDTDEFMVHTNGKILVQGKSARSFSFRENTTDINVEYQVYWQDSSEIVDRSGGKLSALLQLRDEDVRQEIQTLNTFVISLIHNTNEIHRQGMSLTNETGLNFFTERPTVLNAIGNYDFDLDGEFDQSRIYSVVGTNTLNLNQQVGFSGILSLPGRERESTIQIPYNGTDTVEDIITRINTSGAEIVASLNTQGQFTFEATAANDKANVDFVIRSLEDSGQFLVGYSGLLLQSGAAGSFNWQTANAVDVLQSTNFSVAPFLNPASSLELNPAIANDVRRLAAAYPNINGQLDSGDNRAALDIAALRTKELGISNVESYDNFFSHSIALIGAKGQEAEVLSNTQKRILQDLQARQSEISGVDLDEELQNLVKFQTAYQGVAKFLSNLDRMYEALLAI